MSKEQSLEALGKFAEAVNTGNFFSLKEVVTPDCHDHDPAPGQEPGPAGYQHFFSELREGFPDMHIAAEVLVAEGDLLAFAYTLTGTHTGQWMGFAPTGNKVRVRGLQISRFEDGKMAERWGSSDQLGMLQQIGASPLPGHTGSGEKTTD